MDSVCDIPSGLLPLEEAESRLLASIVPVERLIKVGVEASLGCILESDLVTALDFPPFSNAAMDGYAVRSTEALPDARLRMVGTILAGQAPTVILRSGECIRIFTGAPMPEGADAVVVQERVSQDGAEIRLEIERPAKAGENVRFQGEELASGEILLVAGSRIGPYEQGLLAYAGMTEITVRDRLRIGVMATGDELVPLGEPLGVGQIYESNRPVLLGLIQEMGHQTVDLGTVPDDMGALRQILTKESPKLDAIITTGGASEGDADFIAKILAEMGRVCFWKVAIKPGKPFVFGNLGTVPVFGLPGNPVSSAIIFLKLVRPAIEKLSGQRPTRPVIWRLPLLSSIQRQPGRKEYVRARLVNRAGGPAVMPLKHQGSHRLTSLHQGDCLIVVSPEDRILEEGTLVDVELFRAVNWSWDKE